MTNTINELYKGVATPKDLKAYRPILSRLTLQDGHTVADLFDELVGGKYDVGHFMREDEEYIDSVARSLHQTAQHVNGVNYSHRSVLQHEVDSSCYYPEYYNKHLATRRTCEWDMPCTNPAGVQKSLHLTYYSAYNSVTGDKYYFTTLVAPPMKSGTYLLLGGKVNTKMLCKLLENRK